MTNENQSVPTSELIKHVRDPLFCGSDICFTLVDRLEQLKAEKKELEEWKEDHLNDIDNETLEDCNNAGYEVTNSLGLENQITQLEADLKRIREVEQTNYELLAKTLREKAELEAEKKELQEELRLHKARHIFGKGNHHLKQVARDGLIAMVEKRTETLKEKGEEVKQLQTKLRPLAGIEDFEGFVKEIKTLLNQAGLRECFRDTDYWERNHNALQLFPKEIEKTK